MIGSSSKVVTKAEGWMYPVTASLVRLGLYQLLIALEAGYPSTERAKMLGTAVVVAALAGAFHA